ncbi:MAG: ABC transporter ATP-binding protein [Caldilineaceae bacterium]
MAGIRVESVSKRFRLYAKDRPYTLQETLVRGFRKHRVQEEFWALQDVSLEVAAGEMVGVIGRNGAGKSSLLRLVGGIGQPDRGRIVVDGRLGALIDLGAGFHPELTGRENVYMNGVISGLTRRDVSAIMDEIIAFAELEEFIDSPVRTYSSGMQLRLAFSVAVHVQPEVLLVDEVLAVGDLGFQRKCLDRIEELRSQGAAILFVTHDLVQVQQICNRVIWLNKGRVAAWGPAEEVVSAYRRSMLGSRQTVDTDDAGSNGAGPVLCQNVNRFGTLEVELQDVCLSDESGMPFDVLPTGRALVVETKWCATKPIGPLILSVGVHTEDGLLLCEVQRPLAKLPGLKGGMKVQFERLDLAEGVYYVDVGAYAGDWSVTYDYHWHVHKLTVGGPGRPDEGKGPLRPPFHWDVTATSV